MTKKISLRSLVIFSCAALSGGLLFYTSQNVQRAESELRAAQRSVLKEQEIIRVLEAEWAFLNSPSRLEALAIEYLDLVPPVVGQVMTEGASLPEMTVSPDIHNSGFQDVSLPIPDAKDRPISDIFLKPRKKPVKAKLAHSKPIRKSPKTKKSFDSLLNEFGNGGAE